ncbi:MAG: TIR domain-containing protein [Lutibacter sp.]|nr:TIR domain-containing protein [Lutibacter sp.]MDP2068556.1 TIR domain-containing protein [Lutibacter sp.]
MLKLFISYSHKDETLVSNFICHISPLNNNGIIKEWYDRKIETGEEFQKDIDNNLENADIICLMISSNFLSSPACIKEKDVALELRNRKGIRVIPLILSPCAWTIHKELSDRLAIPTDGKPITSFVDQNEGWLDAINWIMKVCNSVSSIKSLKLKDEFESFLNSADILTKSHKNKEVLNLEDIFVYPKLKCYDGEEVSHKYDAEKLKTEILKFEKLIISGENQAGKTTLCKILFLIYRDLNYIPIYLEDENKFLGNPNSKLEKAFLEQYDSDNFEMFDIKKVVPIVDNFHLAKYQEKYIEQYDTFKLQVLIVDDIFGLNIRNQSLIKEYNKFKIREFTALERNTLIRKWIQIKEDSQIQINPNHLQQSIDEKTEIIENSLGIIFGKGIMPSYPFFILSLLAAQDTQKPLDTEITSQGHCYQALIYLYLRREGVKNDQIDIYSNFLTELAYWIYEKQGVSLNNTEFETFLEYYKANYNLPMSITDLVKTLANVNICKFDSLNQFNFCYTYIYYFFVAKYLSEHIELKKETINKILSNLHKDENAYITVFIAHHTKSNYLLDELMLNAEILFEKYKPATLDTEELSFFDKHEDKIIQAILPSFKHNSDSERKKILLEKSEIEDSKSEVCQKQPKADNDEIALDLVTNLRLSIKTVEVMGLIIKNRAGSLDLNRLEYIFEQGLKVHLRILSSFIEIIKDEKAEQDIVELLTERINQIIEEKEDDKELSIEKIEKLVRSIYWNLNFGVLHGFITKAIHSLGSINLLNISQAISDKEKTPAAFIVNQGIKMWYAKNLRVDEIANKIEEKNFSKTAENLMKFKVVEHCRLHNIDFKDLQQIENKLNIPTKKMLVERAKNK